MMMMIMIIGYTRHGIYGIKIKKVVRVCVRVRAFVRADSHICALYIFKSDSDKN